ncbi:MAG: helix-turn-helix transcriptional regulator [Clostridia bacterium]|nr:helix-turn-helix transcriptional regulator [Clostridia bacterium]
MRAYYEQNRDEIDRLVASVDKDMTFPAHFHETVEIFATRKEGCIVTLNGIEYILNKNSVFIADSYDVHSYDDKSGGRNCMLTIPSRYVGGFKAFKGSRRIACPVIESESLVNNVFEITERLIIGCDDENVLRAATDLLFAFIEREITLENEGEKDDALIRKMLYYAQANYRDNASIAALSVKTGYSKEHLSRTFHKFMKRGFPDYVNSLRLDYIEKQMSMPPKKKLSSVILDSGFNNLQSYYLAKAKEREKSGELK